MRTLEIDIVLPAAPEHRVPRRSRTGWTRGLSLPLDSALVRQSCPSCYPVKRRAPTG